MTNLCFLLFSRTKTTIGIVFLNKRIFSRKSVSIWEKNYNVGQTKCSIKRNELMIVSLKTNEKTQN